MTVSTVPLKYLAAINERVLPETTDPDRRFRYIDISTVGRGELIAEPEEISFRNAPSRARRLVKEGDTIVSTVRTYLRAVWPVTGNADDLVVSTGFAVISPREVHPRYLSWWLRSDVFIEEVVARSVGVSYPAINALELGELSVRVPHLAVQEAIADFLDTETARIDALITKKRLLTERVEKRWLTELLTRLRVAHKPGDPLTPWLSGEPPRGWSIRPLKRLISRAWGGDWGDDPGSGEVDLQCVRAADFEFTDLRATAGVKRSFGCQSVANRMIKPGDLVLEKSGGGDDVSVGRVVVWRGEGPAVPTNFAGGMRTADDADRGFVVLAFRAAYEVGLPWRSIKQTTGLQNLDVNHYLSHPWPVPPLEVQRQLADELLGQLSSVRRLQATMRAQIDLLNEHRQALITAAVTGELEVPGVAAA